MRGEDQFEAAYAVTSVSEFLFQSLAAVQPLL